MRPTLNPGDRLIALRDAQPRHGQLRVFRHPHKSTYWLVKRVGWVHHSDYGTIFEARSDNPSAPGAADSHDFGPVASADTYRVLWPRRRGH
jgi:hypothetical protein